MFCSTSENLQNDITRTSKHLPSNSLYRSKKKYKKKQRNKKGAKRNNLKLAFNMSTWAENFAVAATWQLKQQVAFWKARAKSLEYENSVLHDIIHRNQGIINTSSTTHYEPELEAMTVEAQSEQYVESENEDEDGFEVSEQFLQFLAENAKFKEDAKRERELLKAKQEAEQNANNIDDEPRETIEENRERLKELYGEKWQKISALETNLVSKFINECDRHKPVYWPNIPFNFNYG